MMTTKEPTATYRTALPGSDVIFLQKLEGILPDPFDAKIFPDRTGAVEKAHITTEEEVSAQSIEKLIKLAATWRLNLAMSFKNGKITINFSKN